MITVSRVRQVAAAPELVFAALADPTKLAGLLPRVRKIQLLEQHANHARVRMYMAVGPFKDIRSEGDVRWQDGHEVLFSSRKPLLVQARWTLTQTPGGTELRAALSLDLTPLMGPFAAFVPDNEVAKMIGPDLDSALAEVARRVEHRPT